MLVFQELDRPMMPASKMSMQQGTLLGTVGKMAMATI